VFAPKKGKEKENIKRNRGLLLFSIPIGLQSWLLKGKACLLSIRRNKRK